MQYVEKLKGLIEQSNNIMFFGGAGVSTESNIPDFRSQDGIYHQQYKYPPEIILSHTFFRNNTAEFFRFYKDKMIYANALPNNAHKALAKLEQLGKLKAVITQNIDGLHQLAGSKVVYELHGTIHSNHCMKCKKFYPLGYIQQSQGIPYCSCGGVVKPDVVLYEEILDNKTISTSVSLIKNCDVLIVGGTSLAVYPAAGLIDYYCKNKLVLINRDKTSSDSKAALVIHENIGEVLSAVVQ